MTFSHHEQTAFERGYRVSGLEVIGLKGKPRKLCPDRAGYPKFTIRLPGNKRATVKVHRLAAFQEFGDAIYTPGIELRHRDDVKTNFHPDNLILGTRRDSLMDRPEAVRRRLVKRVYDAQKVREFYEVCGSQGRTMQKFGITSVAKLKRILEEAV